MTKKKKRAKETEVFLENWDIAVPVFRRRYQNRKERKE
jgi:hypothetical protein